MWMIYAHERYYDEDTVSMERYISRSSAEKEAQKWRTREWQDEQDHGRVRHVRVLDESTGRFYCLDRKDPEYPSGKRSLGWVKKWSAKVKFDWIIVATREGSKNTLFYPNGLSCDLTSARYPTRKSAEKALPKLRRDLARYHKKSPLYYYKNFKVVREKITLASTWVRLKGEWVPIRGVGVVETPLEKWLLDGYRAAEDGLRIF